VTKASPALAVLGLALAAGGAGSIDRREIIDGVLKGLAVAHPPPGARLP
jgi:hypothetical protein